MLDIIKMTLLCGRETQVFTAVCLLLPCCGTTQCMNLKWLFPFESEASFMSIFPEFKTRKKKSLTRQPHNTATLTDFRSQYVDSLRVEIKSDISGGKRKVEPCSALFIIIFLIILLSIQMVLKPTHWALKTFWPLGKKKKGSQTFLN